MPDSITIIDENKVIDVVLIAGRILLESGAETYRVEDTMNRIAHSYGLHNTYSFVSSTAIIFSLNDRTSTRLIRVQERTTDLEKIALTNSLSRKISNKELTIDEAKSEFIHLQHASLQYSFFNEFLCSCHCMWLLPIYVWRCRIRLLDCSHCWWIRIFNIQLCATLYTN